MVKRLQFISSCAEEHGGSRRSWGNLCKREEKPAQSGFNSGTRREQRHSPEEHQGSGWSSSHWLGDKSSTGLWASWQVGGKKQVRKPSSPNIMSLSLQSKVKNGVLFMSVQTWARVKPFPLSSVFLSESAACRRGSFTCHPELISKNDSITIN